MLPAATSCSSGFHKCVRVRSTSVTRAWPLRPAVSPSRVASSSPPAPPPTITIWWTLAAAAVPTRASAAKLARCRLLQQLEHGRGLVEGFLIFVFEPGIGDDAAACPEAYRAAGVNQRANGDIQIHAAVGA